MTPSFTQWLTATFLDTTQRTPPAKDAVPPHCEGRNNCIEHILDVVDGEISTEQEQKFRANIEHCRPCYEEFDVQLAIRQAVQLKVKEQPVPASILDQIRSKISAVA